MNDESSMNRCVQIRSPSLNETLSFPFDKDTTVECLKKAIQSSHPQQPTPDDQRIIFRGKVLLDTEILSNLLEKLDNQTTPTFHLVVKPSLNVARSFAAAAAATSTPISNHITDLPSQSPQVPPAESISAPPANGFIPTAPPSVSQYMPTLPALVPGGYQVIALNGQFYLAPVLVPTLPTLPAPMASTPFPMPTQQTQTQAPVQAPGPAPIRVAARMIGRPRAMQRGATIWLALKLVFLLFITCHGASIERVIFFHFLALVFFMYQTGRFRLVIRRVTLEDIQHRFQPAVGAGAGGDQQRGTQYEQATPAPTATTTATNANANGSHTDTPQQETQHGEGQESQPSPPSSTQQQSPFQRNHNQLNHTHATRLSVLKRGAYTFVASLWPNYGHDPRLAQAFQNDQQDEMEEL